MITRSRGKEHFDGKSYLSHRDVYGVVAFESDLDLPLDKACKSYEDRRLLELLLTQYKGEECLDSTGVQGDYSLLGPEFVNFVATLMTSRMVKKAGDAGLLDKMTYGDLMEDRGSLCRNRP